MHETQTWATLPLLAIHSVLTTSRPHIQNRHIAVGNIHCSLQTHMLCEGPDVMHAHRNAVMQNCEARPVGVSCIGRTPGNSLASLDIAAAMDAVRSLGEVGLNRRRRIITRGLSGC